MAGPGPCTSLRPPAHLALQYGSYSSPACASASQLQHLDLGRVRMCGNGSSGHETSTLHLLASAPATLPPRLQPVSAPVHDVDAGAEGAGDDRGNGGGGGVQGAGSTVPGLMFPVLPCMCVLDLSASSCGLMDVG